MHRSDSVLLVLLSGLLAELGSGLLEHSCCVAGLAMLLFSNVLTGFPPRLIPRLSLLPCNNSTYDLDLPERTVKGVAAWYIFSRD